MQSRNSFNFQGNADDKHDTFKYPDHAAHHGHNHHDNHHNGQPVPSSRHIDYRKHHYRKHQSTSAQHLGCWPRHADGHAPGSGLDSYCTNVR